MAAHAIPLLTIRISLDPVLVRIGGLSVHWYGLMYVIGIAAGLYVALPHAERLGITRDQAYAVFWPVLIACLIGGRLYYVVQSNIGWYLQHPQKILATWEGGMAFYGAVFLGLPVLFIAARRTGANIPYLLDATALFIPLAQSFGRIGNIVNGDVIGYPSGAPWATQYTNPNNTFVPSHVIAYAPAAAYELLFSVLLFALLWSVRTRFAVPGTLFALWLSSYSAGQFVLFFARANSVVALGLKQAQWTAVVVLALTLAAWWLWRRHFMRDHSIADQGVYSPIPHPSTEERPTPVSSAGPPHP